MFLREKTCYFFKTEKNIVYGVCVFIIIKRGEGMGSFIYIPKKGRKLHACRFEKGMGKNCLYIACVPQYTDILYEEKCLPCGEIGI